MKKYVAPSIKFTDFSKKYRLVLFWIRDLLFKLHLKLPVFQDHFSIFTLNLTGPYIYAKFLSYRGAGYKTVHKTPVRPYNGPSPGKFYNCQVLQSTISGTGKKARPYSQPNPENSHIHLIFFDQKNQKFRVEKKAKTGRFPTKK